MPAGETLNSTFCLIGSDFLDGHTTPAAATTKAGTGGGKGSGKTPRRHAQDEGRGAGDRGGREEDLAGKPPEDYVELSYTEMEKELLQAAPKYFHITKVATSWAQRDASGRQTADARGMA